MIVNLTADAGVPASPSDTVNDPKGPFNGLIIWVTGTVSFFDASGNQSGVSGSMLAGTYLPVKAVRINATGTTATVLGLKGVG